MGRPTRQNQARLDSALDIIALADKTEESAIALYAHVWRSCGPDAIEEYKRLRKLLHIIKAAAGLEHDAVTQRLQAADPQGVKHGRDA